MRTRIKICGITRPGDAQAAVTAGADAIGLVFHAASRRALEPLAAARVVSMLPPLVSTVALFVDPQPDLVDIVLEHVRPDLLQFHGDEDEQFCVQFGVPYIKAIRLGGTARPDPQAHATARALLLDRFDPGQAGGTGQAFDWRLASEFAGRRVILAGGLDAGNVGQAIGAVAPYAVDVSSGVESGPGIKDPARMRDFIRAVGRADEALRAAEELE